MPRISSQAGKSLANIAVKHPFVDYPFTGSNISASATRAQLGAGERTANSSNWTFTDNSVKFVGTGIPYHSYGNSLASNIPANQNYNVTWSYRGGQRISSAGNEVKSGLIGFWLNGVGISNPKAPNPPAGFSALEGFTYNIAYQADETLSYSFNADNAGGYANSTNAYNYHAGTFFNSWVLGNGTTSGTYGSTGLAECSLINYLKNGLTHPDGHSKILGIAADGYPIYGPYGYNQAMDSTSGIDRMVSGYKLYPASNRTGTLAANLIQYPMGIFVEDYRYSAAGDLDQRNGRYCVTPDYPNGTYAYFVTLKADLTPAYPYVIGETYYGAPAQLS